MGDWQIQKFGKNPKIDKAVLIEGLPGIGNVGKIAADYLVDQLGAKKIYSFFSYSFPHTVFVNEHNLVDLPSIDVYHKKVKKNDYLFLVGDVQPIDEQGSYAFTDAVLDLAQKHKVQEVITLGGIGLKDMPLDPKIYCTANSKKIIQKYKKGIALHDSLYGVVGPIVGVSGLLLGLSKRRNIDAISLLAETYSHPMYVGLKGARGIINVLNKQLKFNLNLSKLDKDIADLEEESVGNQPVKKGSLLRKIKDKSPRDMTYIG